MFPAARWASVAAMVVLTAGAPAASGDRERAVVKPATDFTKAEAYEAMSGGAATSQKAANADAFSHSSANLPFSQELDFKVGNGFFRRLWVSSPASTRSADGLGPLFNARSCQRCHLKDGRGHPPRANWPDDSAVSMFLRLSIPPETEAQKTLLAELRAPVIAEPTYGTQLQDFAVLRRRYGHPPASPCLHDHRPSLWPPAPPNPGLAPRRTADDRPGPFGNDRRCRHRSGRRPR